MTTTTHELPASTASDAYLAAVGAALAGVPDSDRQELLDDLAEHLREIAPENDAELIQRLGTPQRYAAELLASAGIEPGTTSPFARLKIAERTRRITALLESPKGRTARAFWRDLRPGWLVVRAWIILGAIAARSGLREALWIPTLTHNDLLDLALLVGAVVLSVWIGRGSSDRIDRRRAWASAIATAAAILATVSLLTADRSPYYVDTTGYSEPTPSALIGPNGNYITNVFAYDSAGTPLGPVFLFDQDGRPLDVGNGAELENAGVPFVPGVFPQPVVATDELGQNYTKQPKAPPVVVPRLPQSVTPVRPSIPSGASTTSPTTAKGPGTTISGARPPVTTASP